MKIHLTPMRRDRPLDLRRDGDVLTLNGEAFDFTDLPEGAALPVTAIVSDFFIGTVYRQNGALELTLVLPHSLNAPQETLFPKTLNINVDGPIKLPPYTIEGSQNG